MKRFLFFLLFFPLLEATERAPWFPRYLEFQPRLIYTFQKYEKVDTKRGWKHHASDDNFFTFSLGGSYSRLAIELEASSGATHHRPMTLSDVALTGRYLLLDDDIGDPISMSTGLTVMQVLTLARHDISCFYHGGIQMEGHLAVGKETTCEQFWSSRFWGVLGLGIADLGSPWVRANAYWEKNWCDTQSFRLFAETLWGLGNSDLKLRHHFRGYGPYRHQSIDMGLLYTLALESGAFIDLGYSYRIYARNCPEHVNQVLVSFLYPFGP